MGTATIECPRCRAGARLPSRTCPVCRGSGRASWTGPPRAPSPADLARRLAPGAVRRDAPQTSRDAAEAIEPRSGTQRARVLEAIRAAGTLGLTDEEGMTATGLGGNSYRPRRGELADVGLVVRSGARRRTPGGLEADVWVDASLVAIRALGDLSAGPS